MNFLKNKQILLYGEPKVGKSTFALQFPKPLYMATERRFSLLKPFIKTQWPKDDIFSDWESFTTAVDILEKKMKEKKFPFETLIIDTVDSLLDLAEEDLCKELLQETINYENYPKLKKKFQRVLNKFFKLPCTVILINHAEYKMIGSSSSKMVPSIPKPNVAAKFILGNSSDIWLLRNAKDGKVIQIKENDSGFAGTSFPAKETGEYPSNVPDSIPLTSNLPKENYDYFEKEMNKLCQI